MSEYDRAPAVAHLKRRCDVDVGLGIVHRGQIHKKRLFVRRFAILGIDLSGDGFNTVDNRGEAFLHLNAFQPLPGYIRQIERGGNAAHSRPVLV